MRLLIIIDCSFGVVFSSLSLVLKDQLPPGASYNPRDVGLDESVLAQLHLLDSGIGGYRFPPMYPSGGVRSHRPHSSRPGLLGRRPVPYKKAKELSYPTSSSGIVPHAMNSMSLPYFWSGASVFPSSRVPYSSTGKGFRSQYGYRAAASELKPQFVSPKSKPFKFLGQPVSLTSNSLLGASSAVDEGNNGSFSNIFNIRSIKGIRSLVSYLTGGISG